MTVKHLNTLARLFAFLFVLQAGMAFGQNAVNRPALADLKERYQTQADFVKIVVTNGWADFNVKAVGGDAPTGKQDDIVRLAPDPTFNETDQWIYLCFANTQQILVTYRKKDAATIVEFIEVDKCE